MKCAYALSYCQKRSLEAIEKYIALFRNFNAQNSWICLGAKNFIGAVISNIMKYSTRLKGKFRLNEADIVGFHPWIKPFIEEVKGKGMELRIFKRYCRGSC